MIIEGKIFGVTPDKSGVNAKTGKKWQKYLVSIIEASTGQDIRFGTFDDQFMRLTGKEGKFEYEENQYGKTLLRLPRTNSQNQIMEELGRLSRKMDEVLEIVSIKAPIKIQEPDGEVPF